MFSPDAIYNRNPSMTPDAQTVVIAANRKAGARAIDGEVERLAAALKQAGRAAASVVALDDLEAVVASAAATRSSMVVIAAGGDGTAAAVANLVDPSVAILPYPLGTENLLARYLGVAADPQQICRILAQHRTIQIDAGRANGRLFLLMASCGFDADVVRNMAAMRRGHIDHFSYILPIYESLLSYRFPTVKVTCVQSDGGEQVLTGKWSFVINLPRYAGGLQIAPQAETSDGLLDVCVFKRGSLLHSLVYLAGVVLGAHASWPDCQVAQSAKIRIEADEPVPYQLDGDLGGFLPVEIEVVPNRVKLLAPESV